jgi:hypothetical protein
LESNWRVLDSLVARATGVPGYAGIYVPGAAYTVNQVVTDPADSKLWQTSTAYTTSATNTFAQERAAQPGVWTDVTVVSQNAATSATQAAGSATAAAISATNAANSATAAAGSATNAAASATAAAASALAYSNSFKNRLINPLATILQMTPINVANTPAANVNAYINDGWSFSNSGAPVITASFRAAADTDRAAIGNEAVINFMQVGAANTVVGAGDSALYYQQIEDVRALAGKTVVLSFWARATGAGNPKLAIELVQNMGTGGSPSTGVNTIGAQVFTLSTTWQQFTTTPIAVPSLQGKTLGTDPNSSSTSVFFWLSAGSTFASRASNIGSQVFTFNMWAPQLEIGSARTPTEVRFKSIEEILCKRYYQAGFIMLYGYGGAGGSNITTFALPVAMRKAPTTSSATNSSTNVTSFATNLTDATSGIMQVVSTALGVYQFNGNYFLDARM